MESVCPGAYRSGHGEGSRGAAEERSVPRCRHAGRDPITGRKQYLKESHADEVEAGRAKDRLVAQVAAESHPDLATTVDTLIDAWLEGRTTYLQAACLEAATSAGRLRPADAIPTVTTGRSSHRGDVLPCLEVDPGRHRLPSRPSVAVGRVREA